MNLAEPPIPLLVIAGPTATGKTEAALQVAEAVGGEIISADAFQIYRGMAIGTAQPTPEEQRRVRFHLIGERDPRERYTVAHFQNLAAEAARDSWSRGHLPIVCGGTGLYLRALLRHYTLPPESAKLTPLLRERLQAQAAAEGPEALHRRLAEVDPAAAARISPNDERRMVRALEVWESTGRALSDWADVDRTPHIRYTVLAYVLTCPRDLLYERISQRVEVMLRAGWRDEVAALREANLSPELPALRALGYPTLYEVLEGKLSLEQAQEAIAQETRNFAKRQLTWFRREFGFTWLTWSTAAERDRLTQHLVSVGQKLSGN
ncbi:MAG TPA: tRNA (adenosine(37)-N6)-dimethylallyltransferase MiaA [Armatimonadota bacterium]|jgi:tRNA dimethylallyltransferase